MFSQVTELFQYEFMRRAFVVGILLAVILPCMGLSIVLKRLSMLGDTLSHSSLAGVSIGLFFGFNPLLGSILACVIAGLSTELIRTKLRSYQEISTVIILAASIGLAGIFSSFLSNGNSIGSYLFGSIVTISNGEYALVLGVSFIVLLSYKMIYQRLYLAVFDPDAAELLGINVKLLNLIFTILSAIAISVSARTIGSLIVSSLLVIPPITAMQYTKSYRGTLFLAILLSIFFVISGLILSYFYNLKPGSVIVLIAVVSLIASLIFKRKE